MIDVASQLAVLICVRAQDMGYWPPFTSEKATATCWLAVSDSTIENGCMRFVPKSHREPQIRKHLPGSLHVAGRLQAGTSRLSLLRMSVCGRAVLGSREESHALYTELTPTDPVTYAPLKRGSITVHNERVSK